MAVVFDNTTFVNAQAVTTLTTAAFTITSAANRAALLGLTHEGNNSTGFSGSCGGVSGALITGTDSGTAQAMRTLMFGVTNPASGSQTATMSWTTAQNAQFGVSTASGVDQTTPIINGTFASNAASSVPTVTITSATGDMTHDTTSSNSQNQFTGPNQTQRWAPIKFDGVTGAGSSAAGAASNTHTWASIAGWTSSGANFLAAAGVTAAQDVPVWAQQGGAPGMVGLQYV